MRSKIIIHIKYSINSCQDKHSIMRKVASSSVAYIAVTTYCTGEWREVGCLFDVFHFEHAYSCLATTKLYST